MEAKFISNFSGIHGIGEILLVSKDKEESVAELVFVQHPLKFLPSLGNTFPIIWVNNEDDALGVLEI